MVQRIMYLGYYFKELDRAQWKAFKHFVHKQTGTNSWALWRDSILSSLKYNTSLLEFFQFRFYQKGPQERKDFAGTGYMYEYQLAMNPKSGRSVLSDKLEFLRLYAPFAKHAYVSLADLEEDPTSGEMVLSNPSGKVVLKHSLGQCGRGIEVVSTSKLDPVSLVTRLKAKGNDFAEAFVSQHDDLMALSPSGLNTVRIITQINKKGEVDILGARLRITINSPVDNLAAGNMAAPIDLKTGLVSGPGVYSDITKADERKHPVTGHPIIGFQVPYWEETLQLVKAAALHDTRNRSIGWDVAITPTGPDLIEGNHDWCKLLWQLPVKKGLRPILDEYLQGIK